MKIFIDPQETFVIKIPDEWYFTTDHHDGDINKQPYGFEPYEKRNLAFNVSYRPNLPERKFKIEDQPKGKTELNFIELERDSMKMWATNIEGNGVVLITCICDKKIGSRQKSIEFEKASEAVKTLLVFDEQSKQDLIPILRWDRFLLSYAASIDLANRAYENGSFIELVVLLASGIDSVLRQSLILDRQLRNKSEEIDVSLIFQAENDPPIMEKKVYKLALKENLIDQDTHDDLVTLYNLRNKVIHRYIISDLRTDDIIQLVWSYTQMNEKLGNKLIELEQKQFNEQIGIYKGEEAPGSDTSEEMIANLIRKILDKHGNRKVNEGIKIEKNKNGG